jgi:hypothetical protein
MQKIGWAKVKTVPPKLQLGDIKPWPTRRRWKPHRQPLRSDGGLCPRNARGLQGRDRIHQGQQGDLSTAEDRQALAAPR